MLSLRFALRSLAKTPGFSLIVILTLAVGIGSTTTIFDLANVFHWRRPAVNKPREVVEVYTTSRQPAFAGPHGQLSWPDYEDYRDASTSFDGLAAFRHLLLNLESPSGTEETPALAVTGNYFQVLGLEPTSGRLLHPDDDRPGAPPVAVLSYSRWQELGADPDLIGEPLRLAGTTLYVVGVAPREFTGTIFGSRPTLYFPSHLAFELFDPRPEARTDRASQSWGVIGRLVEGGDRSSAAAELGVYAQYLDSEHPIANFERRISVLPATLGHPVDQFRMRATFKIFGAAVGLLLLIVCANVANLLLAKASVRQREMGIRQSLGADRATLLRQLLTESALLALAGGVLGLLLALSIRRFMSFYFGLELVQEMRFDLRVLGLTMLTALATPLLFGLAPALATSQVNLVAALKDSGTGAGTRHHFGGRSLLAIAQVALSLVLLISSGLLIGNLHDLREVDRGFDDDNLLLAKVDVEQARYEPERGRQLFFRFRERAARIPGVRSVGMPLLMPPVLLDANARILLPEDPETVHTTRFNYADAGFFGTIGLSVLEGRLFRAQDAQSDRGVVVVNRRLADQLWPGEDAVGRTVRVDRARTGDKGTDYEVIGVVSSLAWHTLSREPEPVIYYSWEQRFRPSLFVLLRTEGVDPQGVFVALRKELEALDPSLALGLARTYEDHRWQSLVVQRLQTQTLALFGATGLLLALLGVFAVMSYTVSQQIREIGIRMAIGARQLDVLRWVLKRGLILNLVGLAAGLVGSFWAVKLLQRIVEGVTVVDPLVIAGAIALLLIASMAAAWLPARRASKLDPLIALRHE